MRPIIMVGVHKVNGMQDLPEDRVFDKGKWTEDLVVQDGDYQ